ncbi:DNA-binding protein [Nakamurella silvestris]|nr:DNA-binding protein [Nakamurella silvestris]
MTTVAQREALVTTSRERVQAADLLGRNGALNGQQPVELSDGRQIPSELAALLRKILDAVADGRTVTIGTLPDELTTSAAAEMLGISRPTLMKLVRSEEIPGHKVGTHTRVRTADVLAFQRRRLERQRRAFDDLRSLEDELGLE